MPMHESPRIRRLRSDHAAMERLQAESSVLRFRVQKHDHRTPPQHYVVSFHGKSLARERGPVVVRERHEVDIKLGASYPRTMPEIRWLTPIYHPNISEIGMVCLGGYGTHWVPSLNLDELCGMLWDMARYHNYDIRSPYNREAALWVANQTSYLFPLDLRALRDLRVALGRVESEPKVQPRPEPAPNAAANPSPAAPAPEPLPGEPGSRAARYSSFLRKSGSDSSAGPRPAQPAPEAAPPETWEEDSTAPADGVVILDMELDLRPPNRQPQRGSEEIVFID
jgi:ubiquitin-protein ligase